LRASATAISRVRNGLDTAPLADLFAWSEDEFNHRLAGSAIRRIGHQRWLRNIAVALGNAPVRRRSSPRCWRAGRPLCPAARTRRLGARPTRRQR
jgi:epoxyqueuosine reductase QueG